MSAGEDCLALQLKLKKIDFEREYRFHPVRRWRIDFALHSSKLAVEVEGGVYIHGRHTRGKTFEADCEKYAEAALLGWTVMRFSTGQVTRGIAIDYISKYLEAENDRTND